MLAHASVTLTLDTYSRVLPSVQAEAAAKMESIFEDIAKSKGPVGRPTLTAAGSRANPGPYTFLTLPPDGLFSHSKTASSLQNLLRLPGDLISFPHHSPIGAFSPVIPSGGPVNFSRHDGLFSWCRRAESNRRHADFQSAALPTELPRPNALLGGRNRI